MVVTVTIVDYGLILACNMNEKKKIGYICILKFIILCLAYDGAEPSGNSIAAENLLRLADYLGRSELKDKAVRLFGTFRHLLIKRPVSIPQLVSALIRYHDDTTQVCIKNLY